MPGGRIPGRFSAMWPKASLALACAVWIATPALGSTSLRRACRIWPPRLNGKPQAHVPTWQAFVRAWARPCPHPGQGGHRPNAGRLKSRIAQSMSVGGISTPAGPSGPRISQGIPMSRGSIADEVKARRTFAIISHPEHG